METNVLEIPQIKTDNQPFINQHGAINNGTEKIYSVSEESRRTIERSRLILNDHMIRVAIGQLLFDTTPDEQTQKGNIKVIRTYLDALEEFVFIRRAE